jgi:hypothetical protein
VTAATDHAVEGFTAHTRALAIAEIVSGLESLEVMELIHHLDLAPDPYLATERETVADWARTHGLDALRQALTAIGAVSTGEGTAEPTTARDVHKGDHIRLADGHELVVAAIDLGLYTASIRSARGGGGFFVPLDQSVEILARADGPDLGPLFEDEHRRAQADYDDGPGHQDNDEDDDQDTEADA